MARKRKFDPARVEIVEAIEKEQEREARWWVRLGRAFRVVNQARQKVKRLQRKLRDYDAAVAAGKDGA